MSVSVSVPVVSVDVATVRVTDVVTDVTPVLVPVVAEVPDVVVIVVTCPNTFPQYRNTAKSPNESVSLMRISSGVDGQQWRRTCASF